MLKILRLMNLRKTFLNKKTIVQMVISQIQFMIELAVNHQYQFVPTQTGLVLPLVIELG